MNSNSPLMLSTLSWIPSSNLASYTNNGTKFSITKLTTLSAIYPPFLDHWPHLTDDEPIQYHMLRK